MRQQLGGAAIGLVLALAAVGPVAAQGWPAYGEYGYGAGYDYTRNPYSYPRTPSAQSRSVPADDVALYGGYMPNAYYTGAAYALNRASLFPSGQAYCETAGSYLYCADVASGPGYLMSTRSGGSERPTFAPLPGTADRSSVYRGVLATRTVGETTQLAGTLQGPEGEDVTVNCTGPLVANTARLTCQ